MHNPEGEQTVAVQFRQAMRHLAATVTIVSTETEGTRYGMTATAVTPVSMAPPSILATINQQSFFHQHIGRKGAFCVNLLSAGHESECAAFGGKVSRDARFAPEHWGTGPRSLPYFLRAEACIFCVVERAIEYGTHTIFVGRVELVKARDPVDPLIYLNGGFLQRQAQSPDAA